VEAWLERWFRSGSKSIVSFAFVAVAVLPCLVQITFSVDFTFLNTPRASSCFTLSSHIITATLSSISLFISLRLGLGRFTRLPTRLPAYHCRYYHLPPVSKKHESRSRVPWPYILATKMSSSEDDKPLVKGSLSITCTRSHCQE
jgi:hypothetical protein